MNNDDLQRYAGAFELLINKGLGAKTTQPAGSFERVVQIREGLIPGTKTLTSIKSLLAKALIRLTRSTEFNHLYSNLTDWQQQLTVIRTPTELGRFCEYLTGEFFPNSDKQNA
ncbi:hypothetical protein GO755_26805 [Spirosoma sp. HMF4905]|uniref:Uncharacterized protein n=1 Tax=Spirosoma arboris TaxID=2682092 RepID=A0A7K1SIY1_9BACT|nr:hypothetical protein [Spirosoma arboris]MVM33678.1 hypothetical protein [Spirosoma arboris]